MSDDWLDITPDANLPAVVALPATYVERAALVETSWAQLTLKQKQFLTAWRECRFNARAAARQLGLSENTRPMTVGMTNPNFAMIVRIWRAGAADEALDRDRLLARQDDIVETLLTPKPILHQGTPTGLEEVEAGAAARANETLMKAAGLLKDKEVDVNVGLVGPTLVVQVMQDGKVVDVAPPWVTPELPVVDADWTDV